MNYTTKEIANYIDENINLTSNSNWTIYEDSNGLTHTTGSMEYRDAEHQEVTSFMTMDEVPKGIQALNDSLKFQMNK